MTDIYEHIKKAKIEAQKQHFKANMIIIDADLAMVNNLYYPNYPRTIMGLEVKYAFNLTKDYGINFAINEGNTTEYEVCQLRKENEKYKVLEKELGFDLIPLLTALTNGYVFWKDDNFIYKVQINSITNCCLKVNTWYFANYNKNGKRYGDEFSIDFKNYGKTWALTREDLENE